MASVQRSSQPSNLISPIPGQEEDVAIPQMTPMSAAQAAPTPEATPAEAAPPEDDMFAQLAQAQPQDAAPPAEDDLFNQLAQAQPAGGDGQIQVSPAEQVSTFLFGKNVVERARLAFAGNDKEILADLKKRKGDENARLDEDGEIEFRNSKDEKFKRLDPDTTELFADIVIDNLRTVVEGATELSGEQIGSAIGGLAGPVGKVVGRVAGGAAGAVGGVKVADWFAEEVLSIGRDEDRDAEAEATGAAVFSLAFSALGPLASKALKGKGHGITNAAADFENKLPTLRQAQAKLRSLEGDAEILNKVGFDISFKAPDGTDTFAPITALAPENPALKLKIAEAAQNEEVLNATAAYAQSTRDALFGVLRHIGNISEKADSGIFSDKGIGLRAELLVRGVKKEQGELIGNARKLAKNEFKNLAAPVPTVEEALKIVSDSLGIQFKDGQRIIPTVKEASRKLGLSRSSLNVETLLNTVIKLQDDVVNKGGLSVDTMEQLIKDLEPAFNNKKDMAIPAFRNTLSTVQSSLRTDFGEVVKDALRTKDPGLLEQLDRKSVV